MLIGNSSATNASVNIFFVISVYILVFNVYCLSSILFSFVLLSFVLFYSVSFYFILFCKDINKTQSAPRFFPKRAWGNLYYYRFHFFFYVLSLSCLALFYTRQVFLSCHVLPLLCHLLLFVMLYNVLYRSLSVLLPSIVSQELLYK